MRVLWFEVTTPTNYERGAKQVIAGWQDSLEFLLTKKTKLELCIAFISYTDTQIKVIDGVTYIPIHIKYSRLDKIKTRFSWEIEASKILTKSKTIINEYKPDLIHIFGTEWPFGLISKYTDIPCVIHIQGSIVSYNNSMYPPCYNGCTLVMSALKSPRNILHVLFNHFKNNSRRKMESEIWRSTQLYMGRTVWDKSLVATLHRDARYFHVEEAIRPVFFSTKRRWHFKDRPVVKLFSVGCSTFWKGPDVMLKVANILAANNINFEWLVAGALPKEIKTAVEFKENLRYSDYNIKFLGFISPEDIIDYLCDCTLYVHTAYIENSPNSICEAQILGVPIVSTNVGGIESLVRNNMDGKLVPANDPWRLAYTIIELSTNQLLLETYSKNSRDLALKRHSEDNIIMQLLTCYSAVSHQ